MIFGMFPSFILAVFSVQRQTNTVNMGCALSSFSFEDISCLGDSTSLSEVSLDGNPITTQEQYYKQIVLRHMQQLKQLDMKRVTVSSESPSPCCVVFLISYMAHKIGPIHYNLFITRFIITRFGYNTVQRWIPKMYRLYRKMTINGHFSI